MDETDKFMDDALYCLGEQVVVNRRLQHIIAKQTELLAEHLARIALLEDEVTRLEQEAGND